MSTQAIHHQERRSFGSWGYAVLALVVAIALAITIAMTNGSDGGQTTGGPGRSVQITGGGPQTTIQVEGGPAAGHPLP
jgi:hypothetical protein